MTQESLPRAVAFASIAAVLLPVMDGLIKSLVLLYPVLLIAWWRFAVMTVLLVGAGAYHHGWGQFRARAPMLQMVRIGLMVTGTGGYYWGLRQLPLADCVAIMFLAPALSAVIGFFALKETPGRHDWVALGLSLLGAMLLIRPGSQMFGLTGLIVLLSAIAFAVYLVITRAVSLHDSALVTTLWSSAGALLLLTAVLPFVWTPVLGPLHWAQILAVGVLGAVGQYLYTLAYRYGRTQVIAPIAYLCLPVAVLIGYFQFKDTPDVWSMVGMLLIFAAAVWVARGAGSGQRTGDIVA